MPSIGNSKLGSKLISKKGSPEPVWKGPKEDGITFSLLSRYLVDPERFRLMVIEGWKPQESFDHKFEFGNMWHLCEEMLAGDPNSRSWELGLLSYTRDLCKKYPYQQEIVDHWYRTVKVQFPEYVEYWKNHADVINRTPLLQEDPFNVEYEVEPGMVVRLRGKRDSVDLIRDKVSKSPGGVPEVWLKENKSKGDIREAQVKRQLCFDLQTMMYLVALHEDRYNKPLIDVIPKGAIIAGVLYNVVRRPFSGGEGTIVQRKGSKNIKPETKEEFYERLRGVFNGTGINSKGDPYEGPSHWFMRWKIRVSQADIVRFKDECLNPVLGNLCDDYEWWDWCFRSRPQASPFDSRTRAKEFPKHQRRHFRFPFGVYNPLTENGSTDLDELLDNGSTVGLVRTANLFPELVQ